MIKQMEEFVRHNVALSNGKRASSDDGSKADMTVKAEVTAPGVKQNAGAVEPSNEAEKEEDKDSKDSQMIFPTLERESPSSSTFESFGSSTSEKVGVEGEKTGTKATDAPFTPVALDDVSDVKASECTDGEQFDDISELEVLSADGGEESEDDGFMTDEEYDILDASDQETVASK